VSAPDLAALAARLAALPGLLGKGEIQRPAAVFCHQPFPSLGAAAALGDDAGLVPAQAGPLLLACEGLNPTFVDDDPWFAGWCGVLVNLSDIAAMGGRPLAVVNSLWSRGVEPADQLLAGMRRACDTFAVPMVGGHTNLASPFTALSVAVLGSAGPRLLSARAASPGDQLMLLLNPVGRFHRHYLFWDAATHADPLLVRRQLALLPELAEQGLVHAAKDISMGGLVGTAAMFAEAAGCCLEIDLGAITPPPGVDLEDWISCFPSFGFLLAVQPDRLAALAELVAPLPALELATIGQFQPGAGVRLRLGDQRADLQGAAPFTGFGAFH